jgi:bifunctional DNA-binding transcriptional regulator/antitoxin component of YhaV-PrlF toxin-antitoxin module
VDRAAIERIGFPEHPDLIRKKLKIKEGRELKVFAMKLGTQKQMILARRLD